MSGPANRKELTRQYKETPRPMGIFCVRNITNGKVLIGSSVDLPARLNRERAQLGFGGHPNAALQRDWNALGAAAFAFEVLDTLKPPDAPGYDPSYDLGILEQLWLDKLLPFGERGYHEKPD